MPTFKVQTLKSIPHRRVRLHSAIGYVAQIAKPEGWENIIFAERARKMKTTLKMRKAENILKKTQINI